MVAKNLAAEFDDGGVGFIEALRTFAVLDDVDDLLHNAFLQRFRFVRRPLETAVHLARHREDGDLARLRVETLKAQMLVHHVVRLDRLGAVEMQAGRSAQADDGLARRVGAVIGALANLV